MRKSFTLLIVSLFVVVLALPAFAQDTTGSSAAATTEPVLQPATESMPEAAPAQTTAQTVTLDAEGPLLADYINENFVRLGEVIQTAGLAKTLNSDPYTVFVPNDGAFITMLNELDISLDDLMSNPALLEGLTLYHVVPGIVTSDQIMNGDVEALETVQGAAITFGYDDTTSRITINGATASIEQPDIVLGNGIVHVIDNVLLPPNIDELIANPNPEATPSESEPDKSLEQISEDTFVVLTEAVRAAGLQDELSSGEYTLFAPNDGAFLTLLNNEDMSYADLLANQSMLKNILEYHLVPGTVTAEELAGGAVTSLETVNGAALSFGYDTGISRVSINGGAATIEQPDIFASNGVVHIIDNVLLPPMAG